MAYSNQPYGGGKVLQSDNTVIDMLEFLESGQVVATAVTTPSEVPTSSAGIVRSYDNFSPVAFKIITPDNTVIDLIEFLMSGQFKVQVDGTLSQVPYQTYLTVEDNTDVLPNSTPLNLQDSGFLAIANGLDVVRTRVFLGTNNQIIVTDGDGLNEDPTFSLSSALILPGSVAVTGAAVFNDTTVFSGASNTFQHISLFSGPSTFNGIANFNNVATFTDHITLSGSTNQIRTPSGTNLQIVPGGALDWIELLADSVNIQNQLIFNSDPTENITYVSNTKSLYFTLDNTTALVLSSSGLKLANGATINNIDNTGMSFSQTDGVTAYSAQQMISAAIDAGISFRDTWDASGGTYPTTGGTGVGGAIEKGNWWYIEVAGTLSGQDVSPGDWITAKVNNPGQTGSNWFISYQGVTSVFNRLGPIVATFGDYSFSLISGNIATSQLPNSGVNGNSQLVQLNGSGQLPAISGVNLTGLTGTLVSSANNLNVAVNGGTASSNVSIVNSISLSSSANLLTSTVNGVSSATANIINTNVLAVSGTDISSTINGIASNNISVGFSNLTGTISTTQLPGGGVNSASELVQLDSSTRLPAVSGALLTGLIGSLTSTANNLSVAVNGGTSSATVTMINSLSMSSSTNTISVTANGVSSTGVNIVNSNSLSSSTNSMTSNINGVSSSANIVNSISLSLSGTALTANVNGQSSSAVQVQPAVTFNTVTTSTQSLAVNNTYYTTYAGLCVMTLPSTAAVGTIIRVRAGPSGNTFKIAQNAGQYIYYGAQNGVSIVTATGTSGYLQSVDPNTTVDLECIVTDTAWIAISNVNNLQVNA